MNYLFDNLLSPHQRSDRIFLAHGEGTTISYRNFCERVNQIANCLVEHGLEPGDRVAMQVYKSWQALALYFATIKAGGVFLPLNNAYTAKEIEYFIQDAEPRLLICDQAAAESLASITLAFGCTPLTLNQDFGGTLSQLADHCGLDFAALPREPDDLAAVLYTSGTTGKSKGAMLTHDNLWSNAETLTKTWRFTSNDVLLHALPIFHTHGLFVATNTCVIAGAKMIYLAGFDIDQVIDQLPRATSMMGVPTFYTRLLDDQRFSGELVRHFRLFVSGSAPLLAETHRDFEQRTGHRILERYGMTETSMNTSNPYDGERRAGTVGLALPGIDIRTVSAETGLSLRHSDIGLIEIKGPNVFKGYWKMPEKTAEEFTEDGYFVTGDLGFFSEDGYLTIVGRDKDLIISGGFNVYPKEIELILDTLPGVTESAVIGIAHPDFGEGVVAILVGTNPPAEQQVREMIEDQIARFKQPKKVFHLQQLPRNSMGKVQKNILREQYADCFRPDNQTGDQS